MSQPTPLPFFEAINGFQQTAAIKAALELDVFTAIDYGIHRSEDLAVRCQTSTKGMRVLCDCLVILKMLEKAGDQYTLTPSSQLFLSRKSPACLASTLPFLTSPWMFRAFDRMTDAVRQGGTAMGAEGTMEPEHPVWVDFARGMAPLMMPAALKIANVAGPVTRVLDVAAGHGIFGIVIAQQSPDAQVHALDWERVLSVAQEHADQMGVGDRYHRINGSAFEVDWGTDYDLILFTNFLHHFDLPTCEVLTRKAHAALRPGGHLITLEFIPDPDRVHPAGAAWFALTMLATTTHGDAFTFAEYDAMLQRAGFGANRLDPVENTAQSLIISRK